MILLSSFLSGYGNTFNFKGMTTRKTFWSFLLVDLITLILIYPVLMIFLGVSNYSIPLLSIYAFFFILWMLLGSITRLTISTRRLRDMGRSGYWIFLLIIPYIGPLILLYWMTKPSINKEINHIRFKEIIDSFYISWKHTFDFKGRSKRKEFWSFVIISTLIISCFNFLSITPVVIGNISKNPALISFAYFPYKLFDLLKLIYFFGSVIPYISLSIRRLRDINKSLYWILLLIIPYISLIPMLLWFTKTPLKEEIN